MIGVVLRLLQFPFIFFIPGYVSIPSLQAAPEASAIIAFAGPATNLLIWLGTDYLYKNKKIPKKHEKLAFLTKEINKFLFIFNMIPIPGFDGSHVLSGLLKTFF